MNARYAVLVIAASAFYLGCAGNTRPGSRVSNPNSSDRILRPGNSLYERLGGIDALRTVVDEWMLEVATDERIGVFFATSDFTELKLRLVERICMQAGGPCLYRGRDLVAVHANRGIDDSHMRAFVESLESALSRTDVPKEAAADLLAMVQGIGEELLIAVGR